MVRVSTYVFFDIETTGLPHQEYNRTKIIELCFLAVARTDLKRCKDISPPTSKLSLMFNPNKTIHSSEITGLTNELLKNAPNFKDRFNTIANFLEDLNKPVCLVAHNGNVFDYRILLAECLDANVKLPADLLCADTLPRFRYMFKNNCVPESILTDDEDEWPNLNITPEEFIEIDELCASLSVLSTENNEKTKKKVAEKQKKRVSCKLVDIYRQLLNKEPENAHRAESDCVMLLECVAVCQSSVDEKDFLCWIDENCKKLDDITPLQRKYTNK